MRPATTRVLSGLASCSLLASMGGSAAAESIHAGGPLLPGQARPPLHINAAPSGSVYYAPAQIRHAYGVDQVPYNGTGQTIAIVDAYGSPSLQSDLNTFCNLFKLPAITVPVYYAQGKPGRNTGWAQETTLDVEWAHAIAPGARIIVVVAQTASLNNMLGAVDYAVNLGANVVSMSWGGSESSSQILWDSHFNKPGVTFVASSGDNGESTGVEWPAASPFVVAVGGTTLRLNADNTRLSETAWSGSGGGISMIEPLPSYQAGVLAVSGRGVPDVSLVGDPNTGVEVVYGNRLYVFGGTSVGAPQWAAMIAVSNSMRASGALNAANSALYSLAGDFFDVIGGNNGSDPDDYAVAGYDLVTGLGSPFAASLIPALSAK